jgi:hypothetical protein
MCCQIETPQPPRLPPDLLWRRPALQEALRRLRRQADRQAQAARAAEVDMVREALRQAQEGEVAKAREAEEARQALRQAQEAEEAKAREAEEARQALLQEQEAHAKDVQAFQAQIAALQAQLAAGKKVRPAAAGRAAAARAAGDPCNLTCCVCLAHVDYHASAFSQQHHLGEAVHSSWRQDHGIHTRALPQHHV